jgi:hypothetical protein
MKKTLIPLAIISIAVFSASFKGGDGSCSPYFPVKQGATVERKNYNDKDKQTGRSVQTIVSSTSTGSSLTLSVKGTTYDDKDKQTSETTFEAKCENGTFYLNMASNADPKKAPGNMTTTVTGDFMEFPSTLTPGMDLKGGVMTINMVSNDPNMTKMGMGNMTITNTTSNRKVLRDTTITTSAGTFNCVKMSSDQTMKSPMYTGAYHVIEYYAKNVGKVRSETYNDKGKLMGYSLITSISGN